MSGLTAGLAGAGCLGAAFGGAGSGCLATGGAGCLAGGVCGGAGCTGGEGGAIDAAGGVAGAAGRGGVAGLSLPEWGLNRPIRCVLHDSHFIGIEGRRTTAPQFRHSNDFIPPAQD